MAHTPSNVTSRKQAEVALRESESELRNFFDGASAIQKAQSPREGQHYAAELEQRIAEQERAEAALKETEDRYQDLVENSNDMIYTHDLEGVCLFANQKSSQLMGYAPSEVVGRKLTEFLVPEVRAQFDAYLKQVLKNGRASGLMLVQAKTGERLVCEYDNTLRTDGKRGPVVRCIGRDVTERRRADQALREAERKYRNIFENASEGIFQTTPEGAFITANPALARMLGFASPEELIREHNNAAQEHCLDPERREEFKRLLGQHGVVRDFEYQGLRKDGSKIWLSDNVRAVRDERGTLLFYEGIVTDITVRKQGEEALRDSETKFRALAEVSGIGILMSQEGRIVYANPAVSAISGYTAQELVGMSFLDLVPADARAEIIKRQLMRQRGEAVPNRNEIKFLTKSGEERWLGYSVSYMTFQGKLTAIGNGVDITEHKRAEAALAASEDRYRDLFENSRELMCTHDLDGLVLAANPAAAEALGVDLNDFVGKRRIPDILAPEVRHQFGEEMARVRRNGASSGTMLVQTSSGERRLWEFHNSLRTAGVATPIVRAMARDITERRWSEALLAIDKRVLEMIATGASLGDILDTLAREIERLSKGLACSVLLLDDDGVHLRPGVAPSLPDAYCRATDGIAIGPSVGSCGTAAFRKEMVVVEDIAKEPLWGLGREIALRHGLRACWSTPILSSAGTVLGTFAMYYREPRRPRPRELELIERATHLAAIAIERRQAEAAVRDSEERYRDLVENIQDLVCTHDLEGRVLSANRALEKLLGYNLKDFGEETFRKILAPEVRDRFDDYLERIRRDGVASGLMLVQTSAGERRIWEYHNTLRTDGVATPIVRSLARDVTDRRRGETALRESEERYRELFENSRDAIYVHDLEGRYTSVNRAAEKLSGYSREEIIGRRFTDFVPPEQRERFSLQFCRKLIDQGETAYEAEILARDGRRVPVEVSSHLIYENGVAVGVQGAVRDITERKQAEEVLQRYPRQLIEAQEAERQSIACELHDQIGQVLTAIHLNLRAVWETSESLESRALIEEGVAIVDQALDQVRNLSFELRPSLLDDLGLVSALRWYADRFVQRTGIHATTTINLPHPTGRLRRELETACFRVVQEALTNVVRHAGASNVAIELQSLNDEIRLSIKDDGSGFDVHSQNLAHFTTQVGLRGMRERALALGGRLEIKSSPSRGTMICAHFPVESTKRPGLAEISAS